jgi:hypothetical protein
MRFSRTAAALALSLALIPALSGCTTSMAGVWCEFHVSPPERLATNPSQMNARAALLCNEKLNQLAGTIKIQRHWAGRWIDVARSPRTATVASAKANKTYVILSGVTKCTKGKFRAAARGSGTTAGFARMSSPWQYSRVVKIRCS